MSLISKSSGEDISGFYICEDYERKKICYLKNNL